MQKAGVSIIIAESFARIFRRYAINIGLPVMTAEVVKAVNTGDKILIDIQNHYTEVNGKRIELAPLSPLAYGTITAGGLINRVRKELKQNGRI